MLIYNDLVRRAIEDLVRHVRVFRHIDPNRIAVLGAARASGTPNGNLATCYGVHQDFSPTFSIWTRPRSTRIIAVSEWFQYRNPRVRIDGNEIAYLILLRLPRLFLGNPLGTLVHELYHIGKAFDGHLRPDRHGAAFNRTVRAITNQWLTGQKDRGDELGELACMGLDDLRIKYGSVAAYGLPARVRLPLIEPVAAPEPYADAVERLYPGHRLGRKYCVNPVRFSPAAARRLITAGDLVLRHYSREGSERIPKALARYSRRRPSASVR